MSPKTAQPTTASRYRVTITLCNTCPFDSSDSRSHDRDHCTLLGYNGPGGGLQVPPPECPWRNGGVEFAFDEDEASRRYALWWKLERESYRESLLKIRAEAEADGQEDVVREIDDSLREMETKP